MQIVINIPDEKYDRLVYQDIISLRSYVENGTVLPKEHGRLIDADELLETWYDNFCEFMTRTELDSMNNVIINAPTIIEADKTESEDKE